MERTNSGTGTTLMKQTKSNKSKFSEESKADIVYFDVKPRKNI